MPVLGSRGAFGTLNLAEKLAYAICLVSFCLFPGSVVSVRLGLLRYFDPVQSGLLGLSFLLYPYAHSVAILSLVGIAKKAEPVDRPLYAAIVPWLAAGLTAFRLGGFAVMSYRAGFEIICATNYAISAIAAAIGIALGHSLLLKWRKQLKADSL